MWKSLFDFLVPANCRLCGSELPPGSGSICALCAAGMPRTGYHMLKNNPVEMRFAGKFPFDSASAHFHYSPDAAISLLIQDFKYRGADRLARELGRIMAQDMMISGFFDHIDYLIPIPLHWTRRLRRGYNQSEQIAAGVADITGIPISRDLVASRAHKSQTKVSATERLHNAGDAFMLRRPERYKGKRVIVLDDVCTTGATLTSAADAILEANPDIRLSILALAAAGGS